MDWQPIETAPDDTEVLLFEITYVQSNPTNFRVSRSGHQFTGIKERGCWRYSFRGREYTYDDYFGDQTSPTHWMPLPEPPEQK